MRRSFLVAVFAVLAWAPNASAAPPNCPAPVPYTVNAGDELHLVGNCVDPDPGDTVSYGIVAESGPGSGSLLFTGTNTVTYRPNFGYTGPDGFRFYATDGNSPPVIVQVSITVVGATGDGGLPPQCPQTNVFVPAGQTIHLSNPCTDPENQPVQVTSFTFPAGTLTPTGPGEADYTPPASGATDSFQFTVSDGFNSTTSTVQIAIGGGTGPFSTAAEATPSEPLTASITLPSANTGGFTIAARPATEAPPAGFFTFGTAFTITAPAATDPAHPLELNFTVDGSQAPAGRLVAFRDGAPIDEPCTSPGATPDPCYVPGTPPGPGGDTTVVIRSLHASVWSLGVHTPYVFKGYLPLSWDAAKLNPAEAGDLYPLVFSGGGNRGLDLLLAGSPSSREVSCSTGASIGTESPTENIGGLIYVRQLGVYTYVWRTKKSWKKTCRVLTMKLEDGSTHQARFRFGS